MLNKYLIKLSFQLQRYYLDLLFFSLLLVIKHQFSQYFLVKISFLIFQLRGGAKYNRHTSLFTHEQHLQFMNKQQLDQQDHDIKIQSKHTQQHLCHKLE